VPSTVRSRSWMVSRKCSPLDYANKTTGVEKHTVSLEDQTAVVEASDSLTYDAVLEKIKKTGKKINTGEADGVTMPVE
jgi:hypothetical protein